MSWLTRAVRAILPVVGPLLVDALADLIQREVRRDAQRRVGDPLQGDLPLGQSQSEWKP